MGGDWERDGVVNENSPGEYSRDLLCCRLRGTDYAMLFGITYMPPGFWFRLINTFFVCW
jgi:hypothetical protein